METDRENIFPGNFCFMTANIRHQQKATFSVKKYLLIQYMISSWSENFWGSWWSHFSITFSWQYNISCSNTLLVIFYPSAHYQRSSLLQMKIKYILSKTIQCLSMSLVVHKKGGFSLFRLMFGVVFGSSRPALACYGLFRIVLPFTSDDVTECFEFWIYYKSTSCRFYQKLAQVLLQRGADLKYYKAGRVFIQKGQLFCVPNQGKWYYRAGQVLQSWGVFITERGRYYKGGQLLLQNGTGITK